MNHNRRMTRAARLRLAIAALRGALAGTTGAIVARLVEYFLR